MMFCRESRRKVEESLERWKYASDRRGIKVCRNKTECICVNETGRKVNI